MARRFSRFAWAVKNNGGTNGGAVQKYLDYKTGTTTLTKTAPSAAGVSTAYAVTPFGLGDGTTQHLIKVVNRQTARAGVLGLTPAELGLDTTVTDVNKLSLRPSKITGAKALTPATKTSQITGLTYKKRSTDAFSIPFGRKTAADREAERFSELVVIAKNASPGCSISYIPERLIRN